ncbi:RHS repeat domain-containing protein [Pseudanabaena sp. PCC 6802]|uniref:RHS repeat domain-containing protein n=1 Tax=Pseudanabaena sp. PCC 6802 TaxID=118173 RepID=UPI00034A10D7|nr:RHS repeat domain-containing protein [Pseudanabaena sp. PCC 6802]
MKFICFLHFSVDNPHDWAYTNAYGASRTYIYDAAGNRTSTSDRILVFGQSVIACEVFWVSRAIASMIDFWGGDRHHGIFAERSPFLIG